MHDHRGDRILLSHLRELGVDLSRRREVNFYFLFPSEQNAMRAQSFLQQKKMVSSRQPLQLPWWKRLFRRPAWRVAVTRQMHLDEEKIMSITTLFGQVASTCGGQYDGWEAVDGDIIQAERV